MIWFGMYESHRTRRVQQACTTLPNNIHKPRRNPSRTFLRLFGMPSDEELQKHKKLNDQSFGEANPQR